MKRGDRTPRSRIRQSLRLLWLHSREKATAMKRDNYSCVKCGVKQSKAKDHPQKIEVHHKDGIGNWDKIIDEIYQQLLCDPIHLECLCPECHKEITNDTFR